MFKPYEQQIEGDTFMAVINKTELIADIAEKTDSTKASVERFLSSLQESILENVAEGNDVNLSGFAKFTVETRAARTMKNPRTGEDIDVPAKRVVKVRPMSKLRSAAEEE